MIMPKKIFDVICIALSEKDWDNLIEIRMIKTGPLIIETIYDKRYVTTDLKLCSYGVPYKIEADLLDNLYSILTGCSQYAYLDNISSGYFTIYGGHRVGLTGSFVISENGQALIKAISSINIRISRDVDFNMIIENLNREKWGTTAIISPPKCGKTTLLRHIIKQIGADGLTSVCVIDERGEICSCSNGIPLYALGKNVCILEGLKKPDAFKMLVRNMSPDVIVCDEIMTFQETEAIINSVLSGVDVIFTIHGNDIDSIKKRKAFKSLYEYIDFVIVLSSQNGPGTIKKAERIKNDI